MNAETHGWETWEWDESLFAGAARYYEQGRLPYAPGLADAFADRLALDGRGRLLDVGCGPGTVALRLAALFEAVVGLDPDADMLAHAAEAAAARGITNASWALLRAEELPAGLGSFRAVTLAASFHWMDRDGGMPPPTTPTPRDAGVRTADLEVMMDPAPAGSAVEREVTAAASRRGAALAAADAATLRELMHPDLQWTTFLGEVLDCEDYIAGNIGGDLRWRAQRLDDVKVVVVGDTAVLTALVTDEVTRNDQDLSFRLRLTQTWVRTPEGWRCLSGHASARIR